MTLRDRTRAVGGGFVAGIAGGLFGVGGGIVLIPILTGAFRLTQHEAHGTSLAVIGATALASIVVYGLHSNVAWGTAALVAVASLFTARYGARLAKRTSARGLARVFAVFLVLVALRLLWKAPAGGAAILPPGLLGAGVNLALGSAVGVLSGFMGVGGGILAVPAFTLLLGMTQQAAQGTSLAVILVAAPAGAIEHARHGNVVGRLVPWLAVGAACGGPLASLLAQRVPHEALTRAFAAFLLLNAVHIWLRATRVGSPGPASEARKSPL
jgi:uncharacterized membrane protein YfcA